MTVMTKPYTKYRCAGCAKSSCWTGAMLTGPRPAVCSSCGADWVEEPEDDLTYRVSWMMENTLGEWRPHHKDHTSQFEAEDQYRTLAEWERTGAEAVHSVTIARSVLAFEVYEPEAAR